MVLLGIPTRGVTLAARLTAQISEYAGVTVAEAVSTSRCTATISTSNPAGTEETRFRPAASTVPW